MKQRIRKMKNKKWFPYSIIIVIVLLLEVFVFNFSTWKTLGCEPVVLAEDVVTNEEGVFTTELTAVNDEVKNVNVTLSLADCDRAEVVVSLTDAGDWYMYDLPAYMVVPNVKDSGYKNIYPYGAVKEMQISVSVPVGGTAQIQSVVINDVRPFAFKGLRVLILSAIAVLGYLFFSEHKLTKIACERSNKKQMLVIGLTVFALILLAGALVRSNPAFVNPAWPHHKQYQELAKAMAQGTVVVDDAPNPALLEKENPYDTIALAVEGISFRMDYAFFEGRYYVYFGIIPELLFFLPVYLLTGKDLPNYLVVFALYSGLLVGVFGTVWELVHRYAKKFSFAMYLLLAMAVSLFPDYVFMLGRPDLYNIPIMGANAFMFLGTFLWLRGMYVTKRKWFWYGAGALSLACVAGCRPQFLLYCIALFSVLLVPEVWKRKKEWKRYKGIILATVLPVVLIAAVVFWYNLARFGNGFDFGATYSLTSNDMNNRGFNFSRVIRGLYSFMVQPPVINATFPFLESCQLRSDYMGKNMIEFCYGGMFVTFPLLLSLGYWILGGGRKKAAEIKKLVAFLSAVSFVIAVFDINGAGLLQRYMGDMVFGFLVATIVTLVMLFEHHQSGQMHIWLVKGTYLCAIAGIIFAFLVIITSANGVSLETYNPMLFYKIASYFKF